DFRDRRCRRSPGRRGEPESRGLHSHRRRGGRSRLSRRSVHNQAEIAMQRRNFEIGMRERREMRLIALTAVGLMIAAPAVAQAPAGINVGMQITDTSGGAVGTVAEVKGDNLLVKTAKHEVMLPKSSFSVSNGKLLFGMTQAQLDAEI